MDKIKLAIAQLNAWIATFQKNLPTPQGKQIFLKAQELLGTDASPSDQAPDELGCAETVSDVIISAGFPMTVFLSTAALWQFLLKSPIWLQVVSPLPGDVIISPTGQGGKNGITNGHTGILGENGAIMSNNSYSGKFESNYTLATWTARYSIKGGYPIYYFRKIA